MSVWPAPAMAALNAGENGDVDAAAPTAAFSHHTSRSTSLSRSPKPPHVVEQPPHLDHDDIDPHHELLGPAIDGPPSPESIRAFSKQVKKATKQQRHLSQQTTSSGSSLSLLSGVGGGSGGVGGERPSWENALEGFSLSKTNLSRKSSQRSTSSSMPSRERPESVQIFGKTIFTRRPKPRRESSVQSSSLSFFDHYDGDGQQTHSSGSSFHSKEASFSSAMPALFSRRRGTKTDTEDAASALKKLQISEPYNFQHVTHTHSDPAASSQPERYSQYRPPPPPPLKSARRQVKTDDVHHAAAGGQPDQDYHQYLRHQRHPSNFSMGPRMMLSRFQEPYARPPPQRPPRSPPLVQSFQAQVHSQSPQHQRSFHHHPVAPPRLSSRASIFSDEERPRTSESRTRPFSRTSERYSPPSSSHRYDLEPSPDLSDLEDLPEMRFSQITSYAPPSDDANWPLPCPVVGSLSASASFDAGLPNVPEEEDETILPPGQSRSSIASNSSLRGSQSVPMLRRMSLSQEARRESGASDTLGRHDHFVAVPSQRSVWRFSDYEDHPPEPAMRENWEDDIDYCYEHAAEADCDYAWDRPSCDLVRETDDDALLSPGHLDVPALSPASQISLPFGQEAITPTTLVAAKLNNFSLPRKDSATIGTRGLRLQADTSTFRESQVFQFSPSFHIPGDFRQHMMTLSEEVEEPEDSTLGVGVGLGLSVSVDAATTIAGQRTSGASTAPTTTSYDGSSGSSPSDYVRHHSGTSTDFTQLTLSTNSLNNSNDPNSRSSSFRSRRESVEGISPTTTTVEPEKQFPVVSVNVTAASESNVSGAATAPVGLGLSLGTMPTLPEDAPAPSSAEQLQSPQQPTFSRNGSESNLSRWGKDEGVVRGANNKPRKESVVSVSVSGLPGRLQQRSRTTSLSIPPPTGQYAMFQGAGAAAVVQVVGDRI